TRSMRRSQIRVQAQCRVNGHPRRGKNVVCFSSLEVVTVKDLRVTHHCVGQRILWIERDRGLVELNRILIIFLCVALGLKLALKESVVSREIAAGRPVASRGGVAR